MAQSNDLTELVSAARMNDVAVLGLLRERFPRGRFHLPLSAVAGVRNRPETAVELGPKLPIHRLRLDNGRIAVPIFTRVGLARECAGRLSWRTDGGNIKTLPVPGSITLEYLQELMVDTDVERAIVNPFSEGELHLARTDVEAIAQGRHWDSLWFYGRRGRLKVPVALGGDTFLRSILKRADRVLQNLTEDGDARVLDVDVVEEVLAGSGETPIGGLASELFALVSSEQAGNLELVLTKSGGEVRVESTPPVSPRLSGRIRAVAEKHLSAAADETTLKLRVEGSSMVVSASSSEPAKEKPSASRLTYIPLEPEPLPED